MDSPVVQQAFAALISAVSAAILLWATWRFPRDHHWDGNHDRPEDHHGDSPQEESE